MNTYIITWNQIIYRRTDKKDFKKTVIAENLADCLIRIRNELHLNPFYLRIDGFGVDEEYGENKGNKTVSLTF